MRFLAPPHQWFLKLAFHELSPGLGLELSYYLAHLPPHAATWPMADVGRDVGGGRVGYISTWEKFVSRKLQLPAPLLFPFTHTACFHGDRSGWVGYERQEARSCAAVGRKKMRSWPLLCAVGHAVISSAVCFLCCFSGARKAR
jgi:hypothetical protein